MRQSAYELSAKDVISGCLSLTPDKVSEIFYGVDLRASDMPQGDYRLALACIAKATLDNTSPNPSVLYKISNQKLNLDWLEDLAEREISMSRAMESAKQCKEYSIRHSTQTILNDGIVANQDISKNASDVRNSVIQELSAIGDHSVEKQSIFEIMKNIYEKAGSNNDTPFSTNNLWLDYQLSGGLRRGRHIAIGAPEKQRKSSWMRNIVLGVLQDYNQGTWTPRKNVHVCLLNFENDRNITALEFVCMQSAINLFDKDPHMANSNFKNKPLHYAYDAERIQTAISEDRFHEYFDKYGMRTFLQAEKQVSNLNLAIYDKTREGGHLRDLDDLWRIARTYRALYTKKSDLVIYVVDHMHLVKAKGINDKNARASAVAMSIQDIPDDLDATLITLAQFNRSSKYNGQNGENEIDVMGTSGASELEQDVQNYMDTQYNSAETPSKLTVRMRRSRRGQMGLNVKKDFAIHPPTGAIVDFDYEKGSQNIKLFSANVV